MSLLIKTNGESRWTQSDLYGWETFGLSWLVFGVVFRLRVKDSDIACGLHAGYTTEKSLFYTVSIICLHMWFSSPVFQYRQQPNSSPPVPSTAQLQSSCTPNSTSRSSSCVGFSALITVDYHLNIFITVILARKLVRTIVLEVLPLLSISITLSLYR